LDLAEWLGALGHVYVIDALFIKFWGAQELAFAFDRAANFAGEAADGTDFAGGRHVTGGGKFGVDFVAGDNGIGEECTNDGG